MRLESSRTLRGISPSDLWELMWRRSAQSRWLAPAAPVTHLKDRPFALGDEAGTWRTGRVKRAQRQLLEAVLLPAPGWTGGSATTLVIEVAPGERESVVRVVESGFADAAQREDARLFWEQALGRLRALVAGAVGRRDDVRQAVIVIHGIGEQQPGRTLQNLVGGGLLPPEVDESMEGDAEPGRRRWVKPDRVSGSFELRKVTLAANTARTLPTTDLFELYWAHVIRDTTMGQVTSWARGLLLRRGVPRPIRPAWLVIWASILVVVGAVVAQLTGLWDAPRALAIGGTAAVVAILLWRKLGSPIAINVVGDAARYLRPDPANIAHRQAIRQAGVDLLERLHRSGRYHRIVVVGHSLGSVIAYDIVTHAWIRMHQEHDTPLTTAFTGLREMERRIGDEDLPVDEAQKIQHAAWREQRRNTQPWLVTDLITAGSPLTYADFLLAKSRDELDQAAADRVLPTCPPQTAPEPKSGHERCSFEKRYPVELDGSSGTFTLLDHGAPFAVTRWTNLYFRARWLGLSGDPVGGPLHDLFGPWIRDVPMGSPVRWFAHTRYWSSVSPLPKDGPAKDPHLERLREALLLESGRELRDLAGQVPAYAYLERPPGAG